MSTQSNADASLPNEESVLGSRSERPTSEPEMQPPVEDLQVPTAQPVQGGGWGYSESTVKLNHNEALADEPEEAAGSLETPAEPQPADLEVPPMQPVQGGGWGYGESTVRLNHNEALAEETD